MLIECDICNAIVESQIIASYTQEMEFDWVCNLKFSLCKCSQCSSPILVQQELDFNHAAQDLDWGLPQKLYPGNLFHINPVIPDKLRQGLIECVKCYKAAAYTATVIMCRKTLESFAVQKGIKEKNLSITIKKLKDSGVINEQLYEWADELRLAGNKAAHDMDESFDELDAKDIMDFTIAILDFTYSFKDKFDKFKLRVK
jgi:hypothetical protein